MEISYQKLWNMLDRRGIDLRRCVGMDRRPDEDTYNALRENRTLPIEPLLALCRVLDCTIEDIAEFRAGDGTILLLTHRDMAVPGLFNLSSAYDGAESADDWISKVADPVLRRTALAERLLYAGAPEEAQSVLVGLAENVPQFFYILAHAGCVERMAGAKKMLSAAAGRSAALEISGHITAAIARRVEGSRTAMLDSLRQALPLIEAHDMPMLLAERWGWFENEDTAPELSTWTATLARVREFSRRYYAGLNALVSTDALTERELLIYLGMTRGLRYEEICTVLNITRNTLKTHLKHLFSKFAVSGRRKPYATPYAAVRRGGGGAMAKRKPNAAAQIEDDRRHILSPGSDFYIREAYKTLRTNTMFALAAEEGCKTVMITSSLQGEGKSLTTLSLAISFAEAEKRVLLIDCDLRRPKQARLLERCSGAGLSNVLLDPWLLPAAIVPSGTEHLDVIFSGDIPPNPSELLGSKRFAALLETLRERNDYILLDTPPVNIVTDAAVLAPRCDGVIIVVRANRTDRGALTHAIEQLEYAQAKLLGIVLDDVAAASGGYGYGKYRYRSCGSYAGRHSDGYLCSRFFAG